MKSLMSRKPLRTKEDMTDLKIKILVKTCVPNFLKLGCNENKLFCSLVVVIYIHVSYLLCNLSNSYLRGVEELQWWFWYLLKYNYSDM